MVILVAAKGCRGPIPERWPMPLHLNSMVERWPIAGRFTISRGSKTEATVIVVQIQDGEFNGRGECVPYSRYGETIETTLAAIDTIKETVAAGKNRHDLQKLLPPGAARNAVDCALWDLEAKRSGRRVWAMAGISAPSHVTTAYTISLDTPAAMAKAARGVKYPLLKLKLGAQCDTERLKAVRAAVPNARLIVDANEGWREEDLVVYFAACADAGVELIEQPLPADKDDVLANIERPVPVCADESAHDRNNLSMLRRKYDAVNIKLDKAGGLTEALALADAAEREGFTIMVGSMVGTSLGVAPALLLTNRARFVDLDGPLLLERDRPEGLRYEGALVSPPEAELWG